MPSLRSQGFVYHAFLESIVRRPLAVLTLGSVLTFFFAAQIPNLSLRNSVYELLVENLSETAQYEALKTVYGSDEIIQVVIKADDIFNPATFRKVEEISEQLGNVKGVRRVISLPFIRKTVDPSGNWSLEKFMAVVAPVELFKKNLISADRKVTAITLVLENEAEQELVIDAVKEIITNHPGDIASYQIGMPLVSQALSQYTAKDFQTLPVYTLLLIAVLLFVLFRRPVYCLGPLMCVLIVLTWTFGCMSLLGIKLSLLTMVVPVFLIAVGTAYCLHIMSEYVSAVQHADSRMDAVLSTFAITALPCALAVFTTLFGLSSLFVNRIKAIHDFALSACFGMVSMLIVILCLLPAVLVLVPLPPQKNREFSSFDTFFDRVLDVIVRLNIRHRKITFKIIAVTFVLAAAGIFLIRIETNPVEYFKKDTQISRDFHDIYQKLSGSFPIHVLVESPIESYFEDPKHLVEIRHFQDYLETLSQVDKSLSFADYLMLVNYVLNRFEPKFYALPEEGFEVRMLMNNYKTILGEDLFSRFMTPELNRANILLLTHMSSSRDFLKTREKVLAYARQHLPPNLNVTVTGFGVAISASSQLLTAGQIKSLSIGLILIFGIMFLMFLSAKVGLIAILPNIYPIIVNFGIMGWLGIRLSMATSLIASIAIGLAVDDTIHYLHRYNREFRKDLDKDRALRDTIKSVGKPIIFTTLTISIGFSILLFSHFKPTATFGFLMVVTMFFALIGDLIILPALMLHVELVTAWDLLKLMPSLGGMPPGIAHDLNQPLNAIKMGSDFLKMMISQRGPIKEEQLSQVVHEISTQVDRATDIISRLRAYGQKSDFAKERVNINEPIKDVIAILGRQLSLESIRVQLDLDETLPPILGHKNRLGQVIYNLVTNAGEAIGAKKKATGDSGNHLIRICTFRETDKVVLTISDTGIGIPDVNIGRIHEPFFTTKAKGQGQGLGLSISHEIIRDLGGRMDVESRENQGAVFRVAFPGASF